MSTATIPIQALLGGKLSDGAIAGFASGLAEVAAANMESGIEAAVEGKTMTAAEAIPRAALRASSARPSAPWATRTIRATRLPARS